MKFYFLLLLFVCLNILACNNQVSGFEKGLLWKITGNSINESYIFGTLHVFPKQKVFVDSIVYLKMQKCKSLVLERNLLNQDKQAVLVQKMSENSFFNGYEIIYNEYGDQLESMEGLLMKHATRSSIPISGLETTDELLKIISNLPKTDLYRSSIEILKFYSDEIILYKDQDLLHYTEDHIVKQFNNEEVIKLLLIDRNKAWLDDLEFKMKKEKSFFAVGFGHLGGSEGLLTLLKRKGYTVECISIAN